MKDTEKTEAMLSPYRVLDLTDEKGLLCGKLLGDMGADVIKIERPGGDPARNIGPFYHDEVDPEKSLFWFAYNTSKRGITLDIESTDGQETFKKLVQTADFVIESFPPGYMDKLGLGYPALEKINPGVIVVSITPFGQTGPYKDYKAPDIVTWALSGMMYEYGDADRPPIRISHHSQAYLHAAAEAAAGAIMALRYREQTGRGQQVDVSTQESVIPATDRVTNTWDMMKINIRRGLEMIPGVRLTRIWPCKDGYVVWFYFGGGLAHLSRQLVKWIEIEGMANDYLKNFDWEAFDMLAATPELIESFEEPTRKFFLAHTKKELFEGALKHRVILYPVSTAKDSLESAQLADRKFWVDLEHPELGTNITYPGPFARTTEAPPRVWHRAPHIGEHNQEVYEKELGLSKAELLALRQVRNYPTNTGKKSDGETIPRKPLEGIRVADFTWNIVGPLTTKLLADYGAEVIRIEGRSRPDPARTGGPFKDGIGGLDRAGHVCQWTTGKLGVGLNLAHPRGVEIARRLIACSDIVAETFAGGVMERLGLGYQELKKIKPDIIMLSSCMQGQTGPQASHPGFGYHLAALSGFSQIAGWPDRDPAWLGPYTDFPAPHLNDLVLLAALDYRQRTGKGQYIDMSQYENGIHFLAPIFLDYVVNGRTADRMGNRHDYAAPHNAYRCLGDDRWCAVAVFTDEEWQSFTKIIGNPTWASDPKFSTLQARKENEGELDKLVEEWTINRSAEDMMTVMQAAGVAAGVLQTAEDLIEHDPQLKHRHYFWELDHPEVEKYHGLGPAFLLSKCPYELRRAPLIGEHNEYALKELLGMSDEEIADLVIEGVLE